MLGRDPPDRAPSGLRELGGPRPGLEPPVACVWLGGVGCAHRGRRAGTLGAADATDAASRPPVRSVRSVDRHNEQQEQREARATATAVHHASSHFLLWPHVDFM